MQKIISLLFIGILLNSSVAISQAGLKNAPDTKYITDKNSDAFLISTKPITNREYLIYILWTYNESGTDYPENTVNAIPGKSTDPTYNFLDEFYESPTPFQVLFKNFPGFVKDYVFNPKYIDYPVIGISPLQASKFCKWLSDRYNENKLTQLGYFAPDSSQINENCFVTESYLMEQYYGRRIKEETLKWSDRILIPTFRIPTSQELAIANSKNVLFKEIKTYPYNSTGFLNFWHQLYLQVSANSLTLNIWNGKSELISSPNTNWEINAENYTELTCDIANIDKSKKMIDYYEIEKDSLGQMPFIIVDENKNKEPIIMEKNTCNNPLIEDINKFYYFRFACYIKPNQYK